MHSDEDMQGGAHKRSGNCFLPALPSGSIAAVVAPAVPTLVLSVLAGCGVIPVLQLQRQRADDFVIVLARAQGMPAFDTGESFSGLLVLHVRLPPDDLQNIPALYNHGYSILHAITASCDKSIG